MKFGEKEYIKQVRADGKEYYAASVKIHYKWFFGLLSYSRTFYVVMGRDTPYLSKHDEYYSFFSSLDQAKRNLELAIYDMQLDYERNKVISVTKIK